MTKIDKGLGQDEALATQESWQIANTPGDEGSSKFLDGVKEIRGAIVQECPPVSSTAAVTHSWLYS